MREQGVGFIPWFSLDAGRVAADGLAEPPDPTTPRQVALMRLLQHSHVTLPIPGTASTQHLDENVAAAGCALADDELERLDGLAKG